MAEEQRHFYGGQAVLEGVMMRGTDRYAVAVRREDGQHVLLAEPLRGRAVKQGWHRWPLIRGNYMLFESLSLGMRALQFSANVLAQEEAEKQGPAAQLVQAGEAPASPLSRLTLGLTTAFALAIGIGLFVLLPTAVPRWFFGERVQGITSESILLNVVEGGVRLLVIVGYILAISMMKYVRRVFQHHGAEHAVINCYEAGGPLDPDNCMRYTPLHPRCGTAFLLVVILLKIILGWFMGWPEMWLRFLLRLALLPIVAALAYEFLRWAGRHRDSVISRVLSGPGLLLQRLTTRTPDREQVVTALLALSGVAPEVAPPAGYPPPRRVNADLQPIEAGEEESHGPESGNGETEAGAAGA